MAEATLNTILQGHTRRVLSVAFSPDSKLIASASDDCTVRLWNISNGDLNAELEGHAHYVSSVAFSPDGKSIVTGSWDCTVRIWSVATKQQVRILNGHSHAVCSVAWSPNGALIASGSMDTSVILWDAISGSAKKKLTGHTDYVMSVSFSQNGNKLVSAGRDNTAIVWDVDSGATLTKLAHSWPVWSVCFSPDDQFVVTGGRDKIVRVFNANNGHEEKRFEGHTHAVNSVTFSFDGSMIASGSWDTSVRLWDVASTKQLQQLDGHTDYVGSIAFSHDGKFIVSGSADTTVCLWNAPSSLQLRQIEMLTAVAKAIRANRVVLKRANLLVLGDSEAGKTSLVDAFQGNFNKVVPNRPRTDTFDESSVAVEIAISGQQSHKFVTVKDILRPVIGSLSKVTVSPSIQPSSSVKPNPSPNPLPADNPKASSSTKPRKPNTFQKTKKKSTVTTQLAPVTKNDEEEKKHALNDLVVSEVVERTRKKLRVSQDGEHMLVISDFAGQEEYRHAHPVFLQRPGLFIVCFNLKLAFDRSKISEASLDGFITESIDFWLFSILTFARVKDTQDGINSIFLVATHVDQVYNSFWFSPDQHTADFIQQLQTKLCDRYNRISSLWERLYHDASSNNVFLYIDSTNKRESISQLPPLRKHIFNRLNSMSAEYPAEWLKLEYRIRTLPESFIGVNELLERINKERWALSTRGGTDVSHEELTDALRYLAQLGTILYFEDLPGEQQSGLSQLVIRSTNFVVKQLQYVINLPNRLAAIYRNTAPPQPDFNRMINEGRISIKLLAFIQSRIRADNPDLGLDKASDDLLPSLLLRFQLCFEQKSEEERLLWCPALFKPLSKRNKGENVKSFWSRIMEVLFSSKLVEPTDVSFWLEIEYVPQGLFTRLLSHVMSTWPNALHQRLYREQAEIMACIDRIYATVVFARVGHKLIQVFVKPPPANVILPYYKIRQLTEKAMRTISDRWFPNLTWNIGIWQQNCLLPFKTADSVWLGHSESKVHFGVDFDLGLFKQWLPSRDPPPQPEDNFTIPFHEIILGENLDQGNFGLVHKGTYRGQQVAVKVAKVSDDARYTEFLKEARNMKSIPSHDHVVKCIGLSLTVDQAYVVLELCDGSLKSRIYNNRLSDKELRSICLQVAKGMEHLTKHKMMHGDLAARNILFKEVNQVKTYKIADFGRSHRMRLNHEYYIVTGKQIPIFLSSPQMMLNGKATLACDVWAFGLLMYELYTRGRDPFYQLKTPFPHNATHEQQMTINMANYTALKTHICEPTHYPFIAQPAGCPEVIYNLMKQCMIFDPDQRITFIGLREQLEQLQLL